MECGRDQVAERLYSSARDDDDLYTKPIVRWADTDSWKWPRARPGRWHSVVRADSGTRVEPSPATTNWMIVVSEEARVMGCSVGGVDVGEAAEVDDLVAEAVSIVEK